MIRLGAGLWAETLQMFRRCGAGERECVVYWTGRLAQPGEVDQISHPRHSATPWHYAPEQRWLHEFSLGLAREGRTVRAQVHTHGFEACHSPTDDRYPLVHTPGFLSLVVPGFAMGEPPVSDLYLVEIDPRGQWCRVDVAERFEGIP